MKFADQDIESPQLSRLMDYWETKRGPRRWPGRRDIDPVDFPYMLGNIALIDVLREPLRFRVRLFGDNLVRRLGSEATGRMLDDETLPEFGTRLAALCRDAMASGAQFHGVRERRTGDHLLPHELLVLPLASDGETADMLMLGFAFVDPAARARRAP
jgi:hypothetical protein